MVSDRGYPAEGDTPEVTFVHTETGVPIPSRVSVEGEGPGRLWGVGFDPRGQLCMVRLDDGRQVTPRPDVVANLDEPQPLPPVS